jgi:GNAT superfamily N-acetyltransferase
VSINPSAEMRDKREHMAEVKNVNPYELDRGDGFSVSTDPTKLDLPLIHDFLSCRSYWARGIPLEIVRRSIENSLCFGLYYDRSQVGFARVVTDKSTFAYLGDVFVLEDFRGRGLGKWLLERIVGHPELQGLRRFILGTRDAHGLYEQFGFRALSSPDRFMEIHRPELYASPNNAS